MNQNLSDYKTRLHLLKSLAGSRGGILGMVAGDKALQLFEAVRLNDAARVREVLAEGVTINSVDEEGNTALHLAVLFNRWHIFVFLIYDYNAPVNVQNVEGSTPLHMACGMGERFRMVECLLENPEIEKDQPGDCPKCGMDLVPLAPSESAEQKTYKELVKKMIVATIFTLPVFVIAMGDLIPGNPLAKMMSQENWNWVQLILTIPVVFYACWMFFVFAPLGWNLQNG